MRDNPRNFNDPGRKTLTADDIPGLGNALLALTKEVWVLTDRLTVLESVLARHNIDARSEIEEFEIDAATQAVLDERGAALVKSVMNALARLPASSEGED